MDFREGARVRVQLVDKRVFEGVVLPGEALTLKLDDGYNIGIDPKNVAKLEELTAPATKPADASAASVAKNSSLPRIDILHTGGTIASKVDYETGGVSNLLAPEELLALYPELQEVAHVEASFVANMSSDDMRFSHYNLLIDAVSNALKKQPAGIVITHGTDTLHYTAAALHYALRGLPVPVVLVGSQRSSDRGSSDAALNLQAATRFCVSKKAGAGVFIAMHASSSDEEVAILQGVHARKMHSSRRDAFRAINSSPVAVVRAQEVVVDKEFSKRTQKFSPVRFDESLRIGMAYSHPHMSASELEVYKDFDGLVVLGTGLGHLPITVTDDSAKEHEAIKRVVDLLAKKMPVVMATQCLYGRVSLQVYSPGRRLQEAGVLGHGLALTPEALFSKLAFVLSADLDRAAISEDFGDLVARTEERGYE